MVIMKTKKPKKLSMHPKKLAKLMTEQTLHEKEYANASDEDVSGSNGDGGGGATKIPKDILVIAQEVKIVQALACNDLNKRNRQLRKLRKWLQLRTRSSFAFAEEDFMRIWKGLYYNMWMSDKPLVQEELAEQLGKLLECFDGDVATSVNFFGAFLRTMCTQWFGIDQWRIDKFLMLVRRMLRYMFRVLKGADDDWKPTALKLFGEHMLQTVLSEDVSATGLTMHFLDIFCEELAKVSDGNISTEAVDVLVRPFVTFLATSNDYKLISHCRTRIFYHLLYQSALGREYSEKYNAWKDMGFPTASIDDLEKMESASADEEKGEELQQDQPKTKHLDPRAGNVDVFMPELPLDAKHIVEELEAYIYKRESTTKCRKMLKKLLEVFQTYQRGEFPLGVKTMPRCEPKSEKPLIQDKISQLENLENEMYGTGRKLKQLNKRKRRKLLKSLNYDDADEATFEQMIEKSIPKKYLKERKKRSMAMSEWVEEEIDVAAEKLQVQESDNEEEEAVAVEAVATKKKNKRKPEAVEKETATPTKKPKKPKASEEQQQAKSEVQSSVNKQNKLEKKSADVTDNEKATPKKSAQVGVTAKSEVQPSVKKQNKLEKKQADVTENEKATPKESAQAEVPVAVSNKTDVASEWDEQLGPGEIEYFIPSRKLQMKKANSDLVRNPLAKKAGALSTPTNNGKPTAANTPKTPASVKRVKIALKHNTAQNPSEYIKQIKSSPNVPYDADKKPGKGLLKPNSMPSPINPFYKKKIGLKLLND